MLNGTTIGFVPLQNIKQKSSIVAIFNFGLCLPLTRDFFKLQQR